MYTLMTKLVQPRYMCYFLLSSFFFGIFMDRNQFEVSKIAKHISSGP